MSEYISDKLLLNLTKIFIYDDNNHKSIPIGNYTSQFFANIYLDKLDKYIKYELRIKCYCRYMDDFIIILKRKDECKNIYEKIEIFLRDRLRLELNSKSRYYKDEFGVNFYGYVIYEYYLLVRRRWKREIRRKINVWNKEYRENNIDILHIRLSINSWLSHIKHSNSYNLKCKYLSYIKFKI